MWRRRTKLCGKILILFRKVTIRLMVILIVFCLLVDCFHWLVALNSNGILLLIRELVLVLLLSLALSLTLPLTSLELSLNHLFISVLFFILHVSILFVSALCGLTTMNITLIVYATIQIALPLTHPAWSFVASLLLIHNDYSTVFNELSSATRYLLRA